MRISKPLLFAISLLPFVGFGQSDSLRINNSIYYQNYVKKDLTVISGYQMQKNHFAEIGIGIIKDINMKLI